MQMCLVLWSVFSLLLFTPCSNLTPLHIGLSAQCRVPPPTHARSGLETVVGDQRPVVSQEGPRTREPEMITRAFHMIYYVILAGGEELHVSILRENVQDKCELQEAHENSYWQPHRSESNR